MHLAGWIFPKSFHKDSSERVSPFLAFFTITRSLFTMAAAAMMLRSSCAHSQRRRQLDAFPRLISATTTAARSEGRSMHIFLIVSISPGRLLISSFSDQSLNSGAIANYAGVLATNTRALPPLSIRVHLVNRRYGRLRASDKQLFATRRGAAGREGDRAVKIARSLAR